MSQVFSKTAICTESPKGIPTTATWKWDFLLSSLLLLLLLFFKGAGGPHLAVFKTYSYLCLGITPDSAWVTLHGSGDKLRRQVPYSQYNLSGPSMYSFCDCY